MPDKGPALKNVVLLVRANLQKVHIIDQLREEVNARVFLECRLHKAALDKDFAKRVKEEKLYLKKFEYLNAISVNVVNEYIYTDGNDLCLRQEVDGLFSCPMDLSEFPFDMQFLEFNFTINCSNVSSTPCTLVVNPDLHSPVSVKNFAPRDLWEVSKHLFFMPGWSEEDESSVGKIYPQMKIQFLVRRKSFFYMFSVFVPYVLLVAMGCVSSAVCSGRRGA